MHEPLPEIKPAKISDSTSANDSGDGEDNADTPSAASSEALDSAQHRKNLNSLAQRKFRTFSRSQGSFYGSYLLSRSSAGAKIKEAKEESARERVNRLQARSAYAPIEPTRIHEPTTLSGLPWGGVGLNYILMAGMRSQAMEPDKIDSDSGSDPTIYGGDLSALEDSSCQDQDLESSISSLGWPSASSVASADEKPDLDTKWVVFYIKAV